MVFKDNTQDVSEHTNNSPSSECPSHAISVFKLTLRILNLTEKMRFWSFLSFWNTVGPLLAPCTKDDPDPLGPYNVMAADDSATQEARTSVAIAQTLSSSHIEYISAPYIFMLYVRADARPYCKKLYSTNDIIVPSQVKSILFKTNQLCFVLKVYID